MPNETGVCPFCGAALQPGLESCASCGSDLDHLSRQNAQNQMGPWFVRDPMNPFLPGRSLPALLRLIEEGRLRRETVIRGPTTRQFWRRADQVPGVAHHIGVCHVCGEVVDPHQTGCSSCGTTFPEPDMRLDLGLAPMRTVPKAPVGGGNPQAAPLTPGPSELPSPGTRTQVVDMPPPSQAGHQPAGEDRAAADGGQSEGPPLAPRGGRTKGQNPWGSLVLSAVFIFITTGAAVFWLWGPDLGGLIQPEEQNADPEPVAESEAVVPEESQVSGADPADELEIGKAGSEQEERWAEVDAAPQGAEALPEPAEAGPSEQDLLAAAELEFRRLIRLEAGELGDRLAQQEDPGRFPALSRAAKIRLDLARAASRLP